MCLYFYFVFIGIYKKGIFYSSLRGILFLQQKQKTKLSKVEFTFQIHKTADVLLLQ